MHFFHQNLAKHKLTKSHLFSLAPVTIRPSLRVVYIVNTGPSCALFTIFMNLASFHTYTSPLTAPVYVIPSYVTVTVRQADLRHIIYM